MARKILSSLLHRAHSGLKVEFDSSDLTVLTAAAAWCRRSRIPSLPGVSRSATNLVLRGVLAQLAEEAAAGNQAQHMDEIESSDSKPRPGRR